MKRHLKVLTIICIPFIIATLLGIIKYNLDSVHNSKIYEFMTEYEKNTVDFSSIKKNLKENSPEYFFILGLEELKNNDITQAKNYFKNAEKKSSSHSILKVYINYYQNECSYLENGEGDPSIIKDFFDTLSSCSLLRNNTNLIWNITSTIVDTKKNREIAINTLARYLTNTKNLSYKSSLTIKGNMGMLHLMNEDYAETVSIFQSIIDESEKISDDDEKNYLKIRAYEYLGNIYAVFGEYEQAIDVYNTAIALPISDPKNNAIAKYSSYINRTTNYIDLENITEAKKSAKESLQIIEYLSDNLKEGVEIFQYTNLALIEIQSENFSKAKKYLDTCYSLLKNDKNNVFLNNDLYVDLTAIALNVKQKKFNDALKQAEQLLEKDATYNLGFKTSIYPYMLECYRETGQHDLYIDIYEKLNAENNKLDQAIKKNYIIYMNSNYKAQQLAQRNKELFFIVLIVLLFCAFITAITVSLVFYSRKIKQNSQLDGLTQVYNRKYLESSMKKRLLKPNTKINIGILMIDIDYFKLYNDFYGHPMGDSVIKQVANCLTSSVRNEDIVIRYGGEEFLVILKNIDRDMMNHICARIKLEVEKQKIPHSQSKSSEFVTLSMGGTIGVVHNYEQFIDKIKLADSYLYQSKENGRNQYTIGF